MFQEKIENAFSKLTGQSVRMEKFKVHPFSGSMEIVGLRIGDMLQIRRISGQMSMAKALKKEIAIKAMTIEGITVRLMKADLKKAKPPGPSAKDKWRVTAESILLRDLAVHIPERELSFEEIDGKLRQEGGDLRFEFDFAAMRRKNQQVNPRPIHGTGSFSNVSDLSELIASRLQLGLQLEIDMWKLLGM